MQLCTAVVASCCLHSTWAGGLEAGMQLCMAVVLWCLLAQHMGKVCAACRMLTDIVVI
jgi:hypothetical protein